MKTRAAATGEEFALRYALEKDESRRLAWGTLFALFGVINPIASSEGSADLGSEKDRGGFAGTAHHHSVVGGNRAALRIRAQLG